MGTSRERGQGARVASISTGASISIGASISSSSSSIAIAIQVSCAPRPLCLTLYGGAAAVAAGGGGLDVLSASQPQCHSVCHQHACGACGVSGNLCMVYTAGMATMACVLHGHEHGTSRHAVSNTHVSNTHVCSSIFRLRWPFTYLHRHGLHRPWFSVYRIHLLEHCISPCFWQ